MMRQSHRSSGGATWTLVAVALACCGDVAAAQTRPTLLDRVRTEGVATVTTVRFDSGLVADSLSIESLQQLSLPVTAQLALHDRLTIDVAGAVLSGRVSVRDLAGGAQTLQLAGLSDLRVRSVAQLIRDRLLMTTLVNVPTGPARLNAEQLAALSVIASPALRPPVGVASLGLGLNAGLVWTTRVAPWNLAIGGSYEHRGGYTPVDAEVVGVPLRTTLRPGAAVRVSLGADRLVGQGRLSLVAAGEFFGSDSLQFSGGAATDTVLQRLRVRLGPQITLGGEWQPGTRWLVEPRLFAVTRVRLPFVNTQGERQAEATGVVIDAGTEAAFGARNGIGVIVRLAGRYDTGLGFDDGLLTAASSDLTGSLGVRWPIRGVVVSPEVAVRRGWIQLAEQRTGMRGLSISVATQRR
ncbi:MAG: hypothetical protein MUF00_09585 [Gemmatimonadaceae bacterium]|jgi:hypothetical protein|nr:hypothetical protein [Gemmatimonadaceae bacterium]